MNRAVERYVGMQPRREVTSHRAAITLRRAVLGIPPRRVPNHAVEMCPPLRTLLAGSSPDGIALNYYSSISYSPRHVPCFINLWKAGNSRNQLLSRGVVMKRTLLGTALMAALSTLAATGTSAQRVWVDLGWHSSRGIRIAATYASPAAYLRAGRRYCEPHGSFVYCWDTRAVRPGRAVAVHVFRNRGHRDGSYYRDQRRAARRAWRMDERAYERHVRAAKKAWRRWYRNQRHIRRYVRGPRGTAVVVPAPAIAVRLSFHL